MLRSRAVAALLLIGSLAVGAVAAAGDNDRATAEATLKEVAASPKAAVAAEPVARSRAALDRGAQLRSKGDEKHALLADSLARTWAEAARDAAKAAAIEETARAARLDATDAGLVADRERALLEEAVAQSGRLRAQLEAAPQKEKEAPARTSAQANSDAGTKKPPKEPTSKEPGKGGKSDVRDGGAQ